MKPAPENRFAAKRRAAGTAPAAHLVHQSRYRHHLRRDRHLRDAHQLQLPVESGVFTLHRLDADGAHRSRPRRVLASFRNTQGAFHGLHSGGGRHRPIRRRLSGKPVARPAQRQFFTVHERKRARPDYPDRFGLHQCYAVFWNRGTLAELRNQAATEKARATAIEKQALQAQLQML